VGVDAGIGDQAQGRMLDVVARRRAYQRRASVVEGAERDRSLQAEAVEVVVGAKRKDRVVLSEAGYARNRGMRRVLTKSGEASRLG